MIFVFRTKADHVSKMDEVLEAKKSEVNALQDAASEKDRVILELKASITDLEAKLSMASSSAEDEVKMYNARMGN